jgi:hypothetical protein
MCKYNREKITSTPVVKKGLKNGVYTASGKMTATMKWRRNIQQNK